MLIGYRYGAVAFAPADALTDPPYPHDQSVPVARIRRRDRPCPDQSPASIVHAQKLSFFNAVPMTE
jgi:hypothetical protein